MDRRTLLAGCGATLVAPLAGCLDGVLAENPTQNEPADGGTGDDNGEIWQPIDDLPRFDESTVVDFETAAITATVVGRWFRTDDGFAVQLDFVEGATADAPATLRATVANTRPFEQTVQLRRLLVLDDPPFGRSEDRDGVYLVPTESHPIAETIPAFERDDEGRWRLSSVRGDWFPETVTVPAMAGCLGEYHLLGHHLPDERPIGPGRYRFMGENALEIAVWPTDEPGPSGKSRYTGAEPPRLPNTGTMAWYHDATAETTAFLRPDVEAVELPARVTFEMVNHGRETMAGNPHYWRLYKLVDGDWLPVHPWGWTQPLQEIGPGERSESALALFHGPSIPCRGARTVGHLGGGRYAYEVGFSVDDETHAAMIDLDAPAIEVEPEADADIVGEGETIVVELPNYDDARRPAVCRVTVAPDEEGERRMIPEQLPRRPFRALRNSLPLFEPGVESIHVRTDRNTALGPLGYDEMARRVIRYEGTTYQVSATLEKST